MFDAGPPDQRQLQEEHEGAGENQSGPHRQPVVAVLAPLTVFCAWSVMPPHR